MVTAFSPIWYQVVTLIPIKNICHFKVTKMYSHILGGTLKYSQVQFMIITIIVLICLKLGTHKNFAIWIIFGLSAIKWSKLQNFWCINTIICSCPSIMSQGTGWGVGGCSGNQEAKRQDQAASWPGDTAEADLECQVTSKHDIMIFYLSFKNVGSLFSPVLTMIRHKWEVHF